MSRYPDETTARFDQQFAQTEDERIADRKKRLVYDKAKRTIVDPRDPDYSRTGMFVLHNCARCDDGKKPCVVGNPRQCEYPHARDD